MKTVLVHGCFDVLHAGHLKHFQAAKKFGDKLIVSITTDKFVNKGPNRPYFTTKLRAEMVKALGLVDEVVISDSATAVQVIEEIKPDYYVKGPDYRDMASDPTGEIYNEKKAVEKNGGKLVFTEEETWSSSTIINKFFQGWSDDQKAQIEKINHCGGIEAVRNALNEISKASVLVIGEPIIDVYRFCTPEGISSKSPTISARYQSEERYEGGALAIANHLKSFCKVELLDCGNYDHLPKKIRYVSTDKAQRVFEITEINEAAWEPLAIRCAKPHDCIVAADFGHGLFSQKMLDWLDESKAFIGLNVQANSSNFGFNIYKRHRSFNYLCLDKREAQLAHHDRIANPLELLWRTAIETKAHVGLTVGQDGAYLVANDAQYSAPSFTDSVVDATGAGDAYFAITTCLLATGCNLELIPFIGCVFAGLKTKIIGNKAAVSKAQLLKACEGILK